jgi:LPXTG-motif cell wall-anchored protein
MEGVTALAAPVILAATDSSNVGPGLLGFVVVLILGFGVFLLYRSMNKHLRRVPKSFDDHK